MNTRFYNHGDKSRAVCDKCKCIVSTTFRYERYSVPKTGVTVPNLLQGFCDTCGSLVSIPHQSSFKIREYLIEDKPEKIEIRVSPQFTDILNLIGHTYLRSARPNFLCRLLTAYYLEKFCDSQRHGPQAKDLLKPDFSHYSLRSCERLSFPFPKRSFDLLVKCAGWSGTSKSDIVKSIIIRAKNDMLDSKDSSIARDFQDRIPGLV